MELICIKTLNGKRGEDQGQINFIKGKKYKVEDVYQKEYAPTIQSITIKLINGQGEIQSIEGGDKTKFFKIPKPEGVPVTPPPPPKSKAEKEAARKKKKVEQEQQQEEWKKVKRLRVKDKSKRIIRRAVGF